MKQAVCLITGLYCGAKTFKIAFNSLNRPDQLSFFQAIGFDAEGACLFLQVFHCHFFLQGSISDFGLRISDFRPSTRNATTGGW